MSNEQNLFHSTEYFIISFVNNSYRFNRSLTDIRNSQTLTRKLHQATTTGSSAQWLKHVTLVRQTDRLLVTFRCDPTRRPVLRDVIQSTSVPPSLEKACIICRNARHREITTCHAAAATRRERQRHAKARPARRRAPVPRRERRNPCSRRCVKYVGCPLERTTPDGAKRARGKEFNSVRYYGHGGSGAVVSAVVLMTSGALTAPVQYRRLTDVCPSPTSQHPLCLPTVSSQPTSYNAGLNLNT